MYTIIDYQRDGSGNYRNIKVRNSITGEIRLYTTSRDLKNWYESIRCSNFVVDRRGLKIADQEIEENPLTDRILRKLDTTDAIIHKLELLDNKIDRKGVQEYRNIDDNLRGIKRGIRKVDQDVLNKSSNIEQSLNEAKNYINRLGIKIDDFERAFYKEMNEILSQVTEEEKFPINKVNINASKEYLPIKLLDIEDENIYSKVVKGIEGTNSCFVNGEIYNKEILSILYEHLIHMNRANESVKEIFEVDIDNIRQQKILRNKVEGLLAGGAIVGLIFISQIVSNLGLNNGLNNTVIPLVERLFDGSGFFKGIMLGIGGFGLNHGIKYVTTSNESGIRDNIGDIKLTVDNAKTYNKSLSPYTESINNMLIIKVLSTKVQLEDNEIYMSYINDAIQFRLMVESCNYNKRKHKKGYISKKFSFTNILERNQSIEDILKGTVYEEHPHNIRDRKLFEFYYDKYLKDYLDGTIDSRATSDENTLKCKMDAIINSYFAVKMMFYGEMVRQNYVDSSNISYMELGKLKDMSKDFQKVIKKYLEYGLLLQGYRYETVKEDLDNLLNKYLNLSLS